MEVMINTYNFTRSWRIDKEDPFIFRCDYSDIGEGRILGRRAVPTGEIKIMTTGKWDQ
jgi:hypothetical protein